MATVQIKLLALDLLGLVCYCSHITIWVIVLPFVDSDHVTHSYFLLQEYSVILPGVSALILLVFVGTFVGVVTWKNRKPQKLIKTLRVVVIWSQGKMVLISLMYHFVYTATKRCTPKIIYTLNVHKADEATN